MIRLYSKKRGFTLIELMIAATIIIVALVGLMATYFVSFDANQMARHRVQALNDARAMIEHMRAEVEEYDRLTRLYETGWGGGAGTFSQNSIIQDPNHPMVGDPGSEIITVIFGDPLTGVQQPTLWDAIFGDPLADPLQINIRVDWTVRNGRPQSLTLVTLMTERE